jgi:hypothetical protein
VFFSEPMVMHTQLSDGRHWLTVIGFPPLQILPVAANHCRAGQFLARVIAMKLASGDGFPDEIALTRGDVADREPEIAGEGGEVRIRLELQPAPADTGFDAADDAHDDDGDDTHATDAAELATAWTPAADAGWSPEEAEDDEGADDEDNDDDEDDDGPLTFLTPLPPTDWAGDYDAWIHTTARRLGLDAPPPRDGTAYEIEMAEAVAEVQRRLPGLRSRFSAGLGELRMGIKVALPTRSGGQELVWAMPLEWPTGGPISASLQSEPHDCEGFELGQTMYIAERDVMDYAIGSETGGVVDPGLTNRIAENYGRIIS